MHKTKAIKLGSFNGMLNNGGSLFQFAVAVPPCVYSLDKLASLRSLKYNSAGNQVVFINNYIFTLGYKGDYKLLSNLIKSCGYQ